MSSQDSPNSEVLQKIALLDQSSQDFPKQLFDLLYGKEYIGCVSGLQDGDAVWLVEYLDQVCGRVTLLPSPSNPP